MNIKKIIKEEVQKVLHTNMFEDIKYIIYIFGLKKNGKFTLTLQQLENVAKKIY
jgi:hypothetical protein